MPAAYADTLDIRVPSSKRASRESGVSRPLLTAPFCSAFRLMEVRLNLPTRQEMANLTTHRLIPSASHASLTTSILAALLIGKAVLPVDHSLRLARRNLKESVEKRHHPDLPFGPEHSFGPNSRALRSSKLLLRLTTPFGSGSPNSGPPRKAAPGLGSGGLSLFSAPGHTGRTGKTTMYLNRLTLIGFIGGDAETKTIGQRISSTAFSVTTQQLVEELGRRVGIHARVAPLRFVRQVGRFRRNFEERRSRPGGRRTSWPRIREGRREAQGLRMPSRIDPKAGSGRAA